MVTSSLPTPEQSVWSQVKPYVAAVTAASVAVVPVYVDFAAKTALQLGEKPASMTFVEALKGGVGLCPVTATLVGTQMCLQPKVEEAFRRTFPNFFSADSTSSKTSLTLAASATVGGLSSPVVAVFNDRFGPAPLGTLKTLKNMSLKTALAISVQETGFVAGLAAADLMSLPMKEFFGDNKVVEYFAAALSGACGGLAGHPGNTASVRWQNGMQVENVKQLAFGSLRRARGCALFSALYKLVKDQF